MRYLGGKSRTYKQICAFLESVRKPNQPFVEPFCGACWVTQGMSGSRYAADANKALITMWKALQEGWEPPEFVSEEQYKIARLDQDAENPLTAFIGFGYSFGGKYFGGYVDLRNPKNHLGNPKKTVAPKAVKTKDVKFSHKTYQEVSVKGCLIYCDPPYSGTTTYKGTDNFNSEQFWLTMREWSEHNTIVISEYVAPDDFVCVWSKETKTELRTKEGRADRTEKLFMHESQVHLCNSQN